VLGDEKLMPNFAKLLIVMGAVMVVAGLALTVLGRANLPLGRLPGDIVYRGKNTIFYFPLATSLLVSVVLSLVLYVLSRFGR
jgi:H+/Cl- antiporter ClcA